MMMFAKVMIVVCVSYDCSPNRTFTTSLFIAVARRSLSRFHKYSWLPMRCVGISGASVKLSTGTILKVGSLTWILWRIVRANQPHLTHSSIQTHECAVRLKEILHLIFLIELHSELFQSYRQIPCKAASNFAVVRWLDQHFTFSIINLSTEHKTTFFFLLPFYSHLRFTLIAFIIASISTHNSWRHSIDDFHSKPLRNDSCI